MKASSEEKEVGEKKERKKERKKEVEDESCKKSTEKKSKKEKQPKNKTKTSNKQAVNKMHQSRRFNWFFDPTLHSSSTSSKPAKLLA